jgi:threonine/homoserine efflux transporter RhtA
VANRSQRLREGLSIESVCQLQFSSFMLQLFLDRGMVHIALQGLLILSPKSQQKQALSLFGTSCPWVNPTFQEFSYQY